MIASAFIGVIVGAGFASGQEVLQYFTSFGVMGIFGGIITTALFAYVGMMLVWLGSKMKTDSHKEVIHKVTGKSAFGSIVGWTIDLVIIFTLFGVGVVMLAGAGSNLSQQFGLAPIIGTLIMTVLILLAGMLKVEGVVKVIGNITPFLIVFIVIISVYSFFTVDTSFAELNKISDSYSSTLPNWFIASINYASFNTAVGASMAIVMGGAEKDSKIAGMGGLLGGLALGV
ncbi:MAG: YkvI family membrane protein, partial [Mammaliicoccus vitulinus]